eukprot:364943-Chlamydomonas_euryale.AAC.7
MGGQCAKICQPSATNALTCGSVARHGMAWRGSNAHANPATRVKEATTGPCHAMLCHCMSDAMHVGSCPGCTRACKSSGCRGGWLLDPLSQHGVSWEFRVWRACAWVASTVFGETARAWHPQRLERLHMCGVHGVKRAAHAWHLQSLERLRMRVICSVWRGCACVASAAFGEAAHAWHPQCLERLRMCGICRV